MNWKRLFLQCLMGCCLLSILSGCWDYRRLDQTATIIGIGIDPAGKSGYQITFQIPSMPGVLTGGGQQAQQGGTSQGTTINITVKGKTFGNAITYAQEHLDRSFFFGNIQSIILNEKLTQDQTKEVLTEMLRNSRIPNTASVISTTGTAQSILDSKEITDEPVAIFLRNSIRNVRASGFEQPLPLWVFFRNTYGHGIQPVVPRVFSNDEGKIIFDGLSVYDNFAWKGDLNRMQARGFNWVVSRVSKMQLAIDKQQNPIIMDITHDKAHMSWRKDKGRYQLYAKLNVGGILVQDPSKGTNTVTEAEIKTIEKEAESEIKKEIMTTFQQFQKWKVDPYGYGRMVLLYNSPLFQREDLDPEWLSKFKDSKLHVQVKMKIRGKGELL